LIISAIFNNIIETLFFLFAFLGTRTICGGYHAKHYYSCFVGTVSIYVFSLLINYLVQLKPYANLFFFPFTIISSIIVIVFAPVEHPNNPMTTYRKNKNCLLSRILSILVSLFHFISLFINLDATPKISFYIGFVLAAATVLVAKIETKIIKRKEKS
jgi:accessory gene regulator B